MLINPGTLERLISETTVGAGTTSKDVSIQSDQALVSYWVTSIAGTLTINVYHQIDDGKEKLVLTFGPISTPSTVLASDLTGVVNARLRIEAIYTGICDYEIYVRAIDGIGSTGGSSHVIVDNTPLPVDIVGVTNPTIVNPVATGAEQSYALPAGTREFSIKSRDIGPIQMAYVVGDSGLVYVTIPRTCYYQRDDIDPSASITLYFQADIGQVIEIESWT